jgi:hypothetical protein
VRCLSFLKPLVAWRIGGTGDMPVESLFPEGGGCIKLASSAGWSRILGIDAVGGSPYCDFANKCGGMTSCCSPGRRAVTLAEVILDRVGEIGDKLGSLLPGRPPRRDGHGAFLECPEARAADLDRPAPALGGASR